LLFDVAPSHHIRSLHSQLVQSHVEVSQLTTKVEELQQEAREHEQALDAVRRELQEELQSKLREESTTRV
jgi:predicted  nucleic acid-binding Zn-ribbon protein